MAEQFEWGNLGEAERIVMLDLANEGRVDGGTDANVVHGLWKKELVVYSGKPGALRPVLSDEGKALLVRADLIEAE